MSYVLYHDPSQLAESRAKELLQRMTLDEKISQLGAVWSHKLVEGGVFSRERAMELVSTGIGHMTNPGSSTGLEPEKVAALTNAIQKFLAEETRLGIPAIMHGEGLASFQARGATIFPQSIGLASTWQPELVEDMAKIIRQQMRATGVHQALAPVLDIARDPRWGRTEETFGEDPYLVASMGTAYVRGLQGEDPSSGVAATVKHFVGYSASEGGLNQAPAHIPERELREVFLFPFECAIREGGALAMMSAYTDLDGVPCTTSRRLLTKLLREQWGFSGVIVSDYDAVEELCRHHHLVKNKGEAARLALEAGVDLELPQVDCYGKPLQKLVKEGLIPEALIDAAAFRVLRLKFLLGLFENPYVNVEKAKQINSQKHIALSLNIAKKSIVLLMNDGILPLKKNARRIAVIGPNADSPRNLLGDYSFPAIVEEQMHQASMGFDMPSSTIKMIKDLVEVTTILEGIREHAPHGTEVIFAKGCEITGDLRDGFAEAVRVAEKSDVLIVTVGDKSGSTQGCTCGEARDSANLKLPGVQEELILRISETGVPVVLVLTSGRPYSLKRIIDKLNAILEIWLPGEMGGKAVADVLFGTCNPGGKLPITFPRSVGQIPIYYAHKPSGGKSEWWADYVDESTKPLFPFGYGLSYTNFEYSDLEIEVKAAPSNGRVVVKAAVQNIGPVEGDEVVQLYVKREYASVTRSVKQLKGFKRITLKPGEKKTVVFQLPLDVVAFYDREMSLVLEPGEWEIMIGSSSEDVRLSGTFKASEDKRVVCVPREYFTKVSLE